MKTLIIALLTMTTSFLIAQNTVTWKGGTPGKENRWDEPKNWSTNNVPDQDSYVIIKNCNSGHNAQPIINDFVEVASIDIQWGGVLSITNEGNINIDGTDLYSIGISNKSGKLINNGVITLSNIDSGSKNYVASKVEGEGLTIIEGRKFHNMQFANLGF